MDTRNGAQADSLKIRGRAANNKGVETVSSGDSEMKKWHTIKMTIAEITEIVENSTISDSVFDRLQRLLDGATTDDRLRIYLKERGWHRRDLGNHELWIPPRALWPENTLFEPSGSALASAVQKQKKLDKMTTDTVSNQTAGK